MTKLKQKKMGMQNQQAKVSAISLKSMKMGLLGPGRKWRANVTEEAEDEFLCFSLH